MLIFRVFGGTQYSDQEQQILRNYVENSEKEMNEQRMFRGRNQRKMLYIDEGVQGFVDGRYDNTKLLGEDSLQREEQSVLGNKLDRALEDREFQKMKMQLQKSKDEFMMKEHVMRQSRNKRKAFLFLIKRFLPSADSYGNGRINGKFFVFTRKIFRESEISNEPTYHQKSNRASIFRTIL